MGAPRRLSPLQHLRTLLTLSLQQTLQRSPHTTVGLRCVLNVFLRELSLSHCHLCIIIYLFLYFHIKPQGIHCANSMSSLQPPGLTWEVLCTKLNTSKISRSLCPNDSGDPLCPPQLTLQRVSTVSSSLAKLDSTLCNNKSRGFPGLEPSPLSPTALQSPYNLNLDLSYLPIPYWKLHPNIQTFPSSTVLNFHDLPGYRRD